MRIETRIFKNVSVSLADFATLIEMAEAAVPSDGRNATQIELRFEGTQLTYDRVSDLLADRTLPEKVNQAEISVACSGAKYSATHRIRIYAGSWGLSEGLTVTAESEDSVWSLGQIEQFTRFLKPREFSMRLPFRMRLGTPLLIFGAIIASIAIYLRKYDLLSYAFAAFVWATYTVGAYTAAPKFEILTGNKATTQAVAISDKRPADSLMIRLTYVLVALTTAVIVVAVLTWRFPVAPPSGHTAAAQVTRQK